MLDLNTFMTGSQNFSNTGLSLSISWQYGKTTGIKYDEDIWSSYTLSSVIIKCRNKEEKPLSLKHSLPELDIIDNIIKMSGTW